MPFIRYFVFVGALLLTLLFAADCYFPAPVERATAADPDRTIIRISSARSLPEKIVFDTRPRTNVQTVTQVDPVAEQPPQRDVREAMASVPAAPSVETKKEQLPSPSRAHRWAAKRAAQPSKRVQRQLAFERHGPLPADWW
jgi:hypothetical protein